MSAATDAVTLVEVGPRDGFQSVGPFIPTPDKIALIERLFGAGLRRIETTSFVSPSALPQMADAAEIVAAGDRLPDLDAQVLVPTARHAERAFAAGARHLSAVLSLLDHLVAVTTDVEIALCDTTGRADPAQVRALFTAANDRFPQVRAWAFHGHDTYGLGAANVLAAWDAGIRVFDASVAGLGGCPFAPGATGNVATEDLVWMFDKMDVASGIDLGELVAVAHDVAALPGAQIGGRVRDALAAGACRKAA